MVDDPADKTVQRRFPIILPIPTPAGRTFYRAYTLNNEVMREMEPGDEFSEPHPGLNKQKIHCATCNHHLGWFFIDKHGGIFHRTCVVDRDRLVLV